MKQKDGQAFVKECMRTRVVAAPVSGVELTHDDGVLMLGSCFTDEIGSRLENGLFGVIHNPFGEMYNPLSVADALERILDRRGFSEDDLVMDASGVWHCWWLHSSFSSVDPEKVLDAGNSALSRASAIMDCKRPPVIMLTFGSAYCYRHKDLGVTVANCHKFPQSTFDCVRIGPDEIIRRWDNLLDKFYSLYPSAKIIFTVSPVRYLSYGPHGNTVSKAVLHLAVEELCRRDNVYYFPAFEIVTDDLRDYRFYADDMVHPSKMAADYVYDSLLSWLCNDETLSLAAECAALKRRFMHRPLVDNPKAYSTFLRQSYAEVDRLIESRPCLECRRDVFFKKK
ncbi:GSCFA domain-containing protein [uncultured Duncaniella sp.]|uniref:GSCFA domain-containing protein n=1 Tax=uncultured Duncaniella sp. TaxID=2768039 RepID=UPI00265ED714|nr:GSCFA domain-containing protein [uncultured Duncaniella sp.]